MPPFFSSLVFPGFKPGKTKLEKKGGWSVVAPTQGGSSACATLRRALGYYRAAPPGRRRLEDSPAFGARERQPKTPGRFHQPFCRIAMMRLVNHKVQLR